MKASKTIWLLLLFAALLLFLLGLNSRIYVYNIFAIVLSFIVYRYGYKTLFKEYDEKQQLRQETANKIYTALREGKKKGKQK